MSIKDFDVIGADSVVQPPSDNCDVTILLLFCLKMFFLLFLLRHQYI